MIAQMRRIYLILISLAVILPGLSCFDESLLDTIIASHCEKFVSLKLLELKRSHESEMSALRSEMEKRHEELSAKIKALTRMVETQHSIVENAERHEETKGETGAVNMQAESEIGQHEKTPTGSHSEKESQRIRRVATNKVAFYATMIGSPSHLALDQDIIFGNVITNIGNAYNARHGLFIAPVRGTYVFSCTLALDAGERNYGHFVVNGVTVAEFNVVGFEQASQTIVVTLNAGDDVSVKNAFEGRGFLGYTYSTFSGFLLYEDNGVIIV